MATYRNSRGRRRAPGLSASVLKLIALLAMTLDHFALIIIRNGKLYGYSLEYYQMAIATEEGQRWLRLYGILRLIGRIAWPIFAFLLVEGFLHTSDFWRYFRRVLLMAIAAQIPFDLAVYNELLNFSLLNVGFTLALGLLVLYGMERQKNSPGQVIIALIGSAAAEFLHLDYGALGLLTIACLYLFRRERVLRLGSAAILAGLNSADSYCLGALAFLPVFFYNGEKGSLRSRWFFYVYYPLHLLVMYLLIYLGSYL